MRLIGGGKVLVDECTSFCIFFSFIFIFHFWARLDLDLDLIFLFFIFLFIFSGNAGILIEVFANMHAYASLRLMPKSVSAGNVQDQLEMLQALPVSFVLHAANRGSRNRA